ncbi:NADH (or F420H2) dehydrogenase, subunit C [Leptothrix cholodnii SP-6]|uniref:NADH-quinone oxidoreductase subunit C n=1 Tax=Leptothrix cholodnii (strain ATCC 51168 / LMG 8142 / SP-6) TaxID=395495 RepID=NUOC_LEPCP|nr:NADH-quinone oxidoreductase subunit C [Leptothrix cholodnii]B1Y829.1 RecName: Full=NADH-quinone oxidoreductase subunit C; AltName: Full=NADH dehydrogenase I subunit C; AltName: Full=NDH-1 subunit C [Leptothrix cholodnii SP-6]ACB33771.1 NADH (or F420H2) dehydrogenase, subunit C [Leptothrix cholodnii SP-6]
MTQKLDTLQAAIERVIGDRIVHLVRDRGELTLTVKATDYAAIGKTLRDHPDLGFEQLIDICGVDYSGYKDGGYEGLRYAAVSHLLSVQHNWRLRLKVFAPDDDFPLVASLTPIWSGANWFEREAFDMYGIVFDGHTDLRRILTDYGFIGHPMRKDFPVTGHVEMRYDPEQKRVIYQPVSIEPREITPRIIREDNYGGLH